MKIHGIGTDIVDTQRIIKIWERYGHRFAQHILAASEMADLMANKNPARLLAKRFAAKEAIAKALGTGFRGEVLLTNIAICHDNLGKPKVEFLGSTQEFVTTFGDLHVQVTIADEEKYVVAFAIVSE